MANRSSVFAALCVVFVFFGLETAYGQISLPPRVVYPFKGDILVYSGSDWVYHLPPDELNDPSFVSANWDGQWFSPGFDTGETATITWDGPAPAPFVYGDPPEPPPLGCERPDENQYADPNPGNNFCNSETGHIDAFIASNEHFIRPPRTFLVQPPHGSRLSAYFRQDFTTTRDLTGIGMHILADDGAIVYIDGKEVARLNCCDLGRWPDDDIFFATPASGTGREDGYSFIQLDDYLLSEGDHTIAVQVMQTRDESTDMGFDLTLFEGYVPDMARPEMPVGDGWRLFKGTEEPPADWSSAEFDDRGWFEGVGDGFGYESRGQGGVLNFVNNHLDDMQDNYSSIYLRRNFSLSDPDIAGLLLQIDYDDAYVAYINGTKVAQSHEFDEPLRHDSFGPVLHESSNADDPGLFETASIDLTEHPGLLRADGENVLAIHALNFTLGSADFGVGKIALHRVELGTGVLSPSYIVHPPFPDRCVLDSLHDLAEGVASGEDPTFDINQDGVVDSRDYKSCFTDRLGTWLGDSNLDGEFNTGDLVAVFAAGRFETGAMADWRQGDWNGDGAFDTGDLVAAFSGGGFEQGRRTDFAFNTVPEPTTLPLWLLAVLWLRIATRKKNR